MAIRPIDILIRAKDETSGVFGFLKRNALELGVTLAGYFSVKTFAGVISSAAEFEAAMSRVKSAAGGTDAEFNALKKAAEDAGAATKYTSVEAAGALENLAKAGLNATQAIDTLPAVLALAQAGDVALATSAEYVTKAVMGMGLQFSDAGRVADVLALGANATNTSVKGLAEALSYAAPTAQTLGLSLETTVAIIGKFADAGIDASRAGTALNSIMSQFSDPASKFRGELGALGITTGDFTDALTQLAASGGRGSKAINAVGLEAGPALKALLNQGTVALGDLKDKLDNAAGSAAATAKTMGDNLAGSMTGLGSVWDTIKTKLGTPVLPVLKDGVDQLTSSLRELVTNGTITKFGESFAEAFRAAIKWGRDFFDQIDFKAVVTDLQAFAAQAGETFKAIGENASVAGNAAKTAYGVMSAGTNFVLAAVYKVGEAFAGVASNIQSGVALLYDAFAKIKFGNVSAAYKQAADDIRLSANATMAASEELGKKSAAAFVAVADSAQTARNGFAGMAGAATGSKPALDALSAAQQAATKELEAGAAAAAAYGIAQQKKANAEQVAKQAADDHKASAQALRAEYEKQLALGNWQGAAEIMVKIDAAARGAAVAVRLSSQQIEAAAASLVAYNAIGDANLRLELAKEKASEAAAKAAGNEYAQTQSKIAQKEIEIKMVEANAKAMAEEAATSIRVAEAKMTEARASKDGLTPELEAELQSRINLAKAKQLDAKATAASADVMRSEIDMLRKGADARDKSTAAIDKNRTALEKLNAEKEREIAAQEKSNDLATRELKLQEAKRTAGTITNVDAVPTFNTRAEADAWLAESRKQYARDNPFSTKSSGSLGNMAMDLMMAEWRAEVNALAKRDAMKSANGGNSPASTNTSPTPGTTTGTTVNITVEGIRRSINTDSAGSRDLQDLIRQLAQAKGSSI